MGLHKIISIGEVYHADAKKICLLYAPIFGHLAVSDSCDAAT